MIAIYFDSQNNTYSAAHAGGLLFHGCQRDYSIRALAAVLNVTASEAGEFLDANIVSAAVWRATFASAVSADLESLTASIVDVEESNVASKAELESKLEKLKGQLSSLSATAVRDRTVSDARNRIAELQQVLRDRVPWIKEQLGPHSDNPMMLNAILNNSPESIEIRRLQGVING
jgi:hypothetical protein